MTSSQATTSNADHAVSLGDRVMVNGKAGTVAFRGPTKFSTGEWCGIILDEVQGKNDGSCEGVRYFQTEQNRGLFCRTEKVQRIARNGSGASSSNAPRVSWIDDSSSSHSAPLKDLQIGDRVVIGGTKTGILKYIGKIHISEGIWCGVKLDEPIGKNNGKLDGTRYFKCQHRYGLFAPLRRVEKMDMNSTEARLLARQSIMSTTSFNQTDDSSSDEMNFSDFSTASNNVPHFQPRSPIKSSSELTNSLMETLKEKEKLLEQEHQQSSRAMEKLEETSNQMKLLEQQYQMKINENEQLIREHFQSRQRLEELQFQLEEFRLRATAIPTSNFDDGDNTEDYEEKYRELQAINQHLIVDNQRLEDELHQKYVNDLESIRSQYEKVISDKERQLNDLQVKEQLNYQQYQSKIDHLTKEEQKIRSQLLNIEQEKQQTEQRLNDLMNEFQHQRDTVIPRLQKECEQFKAQLEQRNQIDQSVLLNERETFYQQQLQLEQVKLNKIVQEFTEREQEKNQVYTERQLEYEQRLAEYEQNLQEALHKTQLVEHQLVEFREEKTSLDSVQDNYEKQYQTLIRQFDENQNQLKIVQTERDDVREENRGLQTALNQLQQENLLHETQLNETIRTLKQDLAELHERERTTHRLLTQRQSEYEQSVAEYEKNLQDALKKTQLVERQMIEFQEEKTSHDRNSNEIIQSLKEDYEKQYETLKEEFDELQKRDYNQNTLSNEREEYYQSLIKQHQIELDQAMEKIRQLEEHQQSNETIDRLKKEFEKEKQELQQELTELNNRELEAHRHLHQRESQFDQQLDSLKLQFNQEKTSYENQLKALKDQYDQLKNENVNTNEEELIELRTTVDQLNEQILQLQQQLTDQEIQSASSFKQRQVAFEKELDEYQINLELALREKQNLQIELDNLQDERVSGEETLHSLRDDLQNQIDLLRTENQQLQKQEQNKANELKKKKEEHQQQLQETKAKLRDLENTIEQYKVELDEKKQLYTQIEELTEANKILKAEVEHNASKNEQKDDNQIAELQKINQELLERQAQFLQQFAEEKESQEKLLKTKTSQLEMAMAMLKSEHMVAMENMRYDYDQEILRLKNLLPKGKK